MTKRYLSAKEVAELLGIAESTAYAVIRGWNKELKSEGYFTKAGSVPRAYFEKKCYGFSEAQQGEREFLDKQSGNMNMKLAAFVNVSEDDTEPADGTV